MSASDTQRQMTPAELAVEIANQLAQFEALHVEWNNAKAEAVRARDKLEATAPYRRWSLLDVELRRLAGEQRACGLRISDLERLKHGGDIPGYNPEGGAR